MTTYRWHESDFIEEFAASRNARLSGGRGAPWQVEGGLAGLPWRLTLTPASGESGPQIAWTCPAVRAGRDTHQFLVRRAARSGEGPFGGIEGGLAGMIAAGTMLAAGALFTRYRKARAEPARDPAPLPAGVLGPDWSVLDPLGVLTPGVASLFAAWPDAWWGPGDERPARLDSVWLNQYGLQVTAGDWWCSRPALDQLATIGERIAPALQAAGC